MEYCNEGDLRKFLKKSRDHPLSILDKIMLMEDIAKGLKHLHLHGILHRDLAARNVLIHYDTEGYHAKICGTSPRAPCLPPPPFSTTTLSLFHYSRRIRLLFFCLLTLLLSFSFSFFVGDFGMSRPGTEYVSSSGIGAVKVRQHFFPLSVCFLLHQLTDFKLFLVDATGGHHSSLAPLFSTVGRRLGFRRRLLGDSK